MLVHCLCSRAFKVHIIFTDESVLKGIFIVLLQLNTLKDIINNNGNKRVHCLMTNTMKPFYQNVGEMCRVIQVKIPKTPIYNENSIKQEYDLNLY